MSIGRGWNEGKMSVAWVNRRRCSGGVRCGKEGLGFGEMIIVIPLLFNLYMHISGSDS